MNTLSADGPQRPSPSPQRPARVLLVDKDRPVRDAIRDLITADPAIIVVGETVTRAQAQDFVSAMDPDVIVLETRLPDGDGLRLCRHLACDHARSRCLVLTSDVEPRTLLEALRAGAAGYLVKDLTDLALAEAVKAIAAGESWFDTHPAPALIHRSHRRMAGASGLLGQLTTLELAILLLLADGLTDRQIATQVSLTEKVVEHTVSRICGKLRLRDRAQAAAYAARPA